MGQEPKANGDQLDEEHLSGVPQLNPVIQDLGQISWIVSVLLGSAKMIM